MATAKSPDLLNKELLRAQSHPTRAHILNILSEGPSSPARMQRRMGGSISLELVSHHVNVLRDVGLIELVEIRKHGGRNEHIYRALRRQYFDAEEWEAVEPSYRQPLITTILAQISEDTGRAAAEGRFAEIPDSHLSRSPIELDQAGWDEVVGVLSGALDDVLEAHARSAERSRASGEALKPSRVMIMQFPVGRDEPIENPGA